MPIAQSSIDSLLRSPYGEAAYKAAEILTDAGFEAWWVGGSVRDLLLNKEPKDIDLATGATPDDIKKLFPKHNSAGEKFGSLVVHVGKKEFEVTTFRKDSYATDGRRPQSIEFGTREDDAARRDITMNALYYQPITRELYDPFNGEKDLSEKLIRIIGNPKERFLQDALRLLRVVRFRALFSGQYHPDTFKALHENAALVNVLSGSRVLEELGKMLMGPHPERALEDLWETDILQYLIPELHACKGVGQPKDYHHEGDVWDHMMQLVASFTPEHDADVRIAGLFHDCGKAKTFTLEERIRFDNHASVSGDSTKEVLERFQCPVQRKDKIVWLVRHHMMMGSFFEMNDERKAHWYYHPWFGELLQLFWLDIAGTTPSDFELYERIVHDRNAFLDSRPKPPVQLLSGNEVMELLGIQPGEAVGKALKDLHDAQVRGEVTTKKEAISFLNKS